MNGQQLSMDVIAHNLANVSTTGFKKSTTDFQDLLYDTIRVPGSATSSDTQSPTGLMVGMGVRPAAVTKVFSQGEVYLTENELDVAIDGNGFFEVELPNGSSGYTRAGAFRLDADGTLVNPEGYRILPSITIPEGSSRITISDTGVVSAVLAGESQSTELGNLELVRFTNTAGLSASGSNIYMETNASGSPITGTPGSDGFGVLLQTFLEGSNVNIVQEIGNMIVTQRAYEINSKAITTSDEMMQVTNGLK